MSSQVTGRRPGTRPRSAAPSVYDRRDSGWTSLGRDTTVPRPRRSMRPSTNSSCRAWRTVSRDTPNRAASSRSGGTASPSARSARRSSTAVRTRYGLDIRCGEVIGKTLKTLVPVRVSRPSARRRSMPHCRADPWRRRRSAAAEARRATTGDRGMPPSTRRAPLVVQRVDRHVGQRGRRSPARWPPGSAWLPTWAPASQPTRSPKRGVSHSLANRSWCAARCRRRAGCVPDRAARSEHQFIVGAVVAGPARRLQRVGEFVDRFLVQDPAQRIAAARQSLRARSCCRSCLQTTRNTVYTNCSSVVSANIPQMVWTECGHAVSRCELRLWAEESSERHMPTRRSAADTTSSSLERETRGARRHRPQLRIWSGCPAGPTDELRRVAALP